MFDEPTTERVLADLASTYDLDLVAGVYDAIRSVREAWAVWRVDPGYPVLGSPLRLITDVHGESVAASMRTIGAVAPDDLAGAVRAAGHVLGEFFVIGSPAEVAVAEAAEVLRYRAMTLPQQVRDARTLTRRDIG